MHRTELFQILWNSAQRAREEGDRDSANIFVTNALRILGIDLADLLGQQPAPDNDTPIAKLDERALHERPQTVHGGLASGAS